MRERNYNTSIVAFKGLTTLSSKSVRAFKTTKYVTFEPHFFSSSFSAYSSSSIRTNLYCFPLGQELLYDLCVLGGGVEWVGGESVCVCMCVGVLDGCH